MDIQIKQPRGIYILEVVTDTWKKAFDKGDAFRVMGSPLVGFGDDRLKNLDVLLQEGWHKEEEEHTFIWAEDDSPVVTRMCVHYYYMLPDKITPQHYWISKDGYEAIWTLNIKSPTWWDIALKLPQQ